MITYPEIPKGCIQHFRAYIFDKLDGFNLRFAWSKKKGWYLQGTRERLFDKTDPLFGEAIPLFKEVLADGIEKVAIENRWDKLVAFAEFYGENSFAGICPAGDKKYIKLFDVYTPQQGIINPKPYIKLFGHLETAKLLGVDFWNRDFVQCVRENRIAGITFEGVVAKGIVNGHLCMEKAKTQAWLDKVHKIHSPDVAKKIANS